MADGDKVFTGSIPKVYDTHLVPLIFEPYAQDLAKRLATRKFARLLEIAAGTGVATRALASALPSHVSIVATDLNQAMIDEAAAVGTSRQVEWKQADAMQLPFDDESFDAAVCQFGAMFFPDRGKAFAEVRRVLRPGGVFVFSAWDRIEENDFIFVVESELAEIFPHNPPRFMSRTPHGYHDKAQIARDLAAGGFTKPALIETVPARSRAGSPQSAVTGYCKGSPLRAEIETRGPPGLEGAIERSVQALANRFGDGPIEGKIQAIVVTVEK